MSVEAWIVFTKAQRDEAVEHSKSTDFKVLPRPVDNPLVAKLNEPLVTLESYVAPARLFNDAEYAPVWTERLRGYPVRVVDSETLFLPRSTAINPSLDDDAAGGI